MIIFETRYQDVTGNKYNNFIQIDFIIIQFCKQQDSDLYWIIRSANINELIYHRRAVSIETRLVNGTQL